MGFTATDDAVSATSPESVAAPGENMELVREFSWIGALSLAWNCVNVFGGLSFIFVVGFSDGGLPAIFYGYIGASVCVGCMIAILAECASIFPTAGGAYHFATFLIPMKHRRFSGFILGWMNFLAWSLASAACCAIVSPIIFAFVFESHPTFELDGRYQLFLVYVGTAVIAWLVNMFLLGIIPLLANIGCWMTVAGFVGFFIALLAISDKATPEAVFVTVVNESGYSSNAMAVVLGLYNSMTALVALDASCHMAEEVPQPTRVIPRILYLTLIVQFLVGTVWILVIGFCITDADAIINARSQVPIFEVVKLATKSKAAEYVFMVLLLFNYFSGTIGCTLTASRQGYALARDGGLFMRSRMASVHPTLNVPVWCCHLVFVITVVVGFVYLGSSTGFNAILGVDAAFMILSYAAPGFVMILTRRKGLIKTPYSLGRWGYVCAVIAVLYAVLATVLIMVNIHPGCILLVTVTDRQIPSVHPIEANNMNYSVVIFVAAFIIMGVAWFAGANKTYTPPEMKTLAGIETSSDLEQPEEFSSDMSAKA